MKDLFTFPNKIRIEKAETIFKYLPELQNKSKEVRYSRKNEFNDEIVKSFLSKKIDLNSKSFEKNLYKDPYILKKI